MKTDLAFGICLTIALWASFQIAVCDDAVVAAPLTPPSPDALERPSVESFSLQIPQATTDPVIKVTPYGSLWASFIAATSRTNPGEFTLWVPSEESQGEGTLTIDARRTRIGIDVSGPELDLFGGLESSGQVEFDFFGEFVTENRAGARLRQAWWDIHNDDYRFLVGQTWDVISPLKPRMLNFSVGWTGGNIGFRRAQFRAERFITLDPESHLELQTSLNQDIVPDFPTDSGITRETSDWPVLEGRVGWVSKPRHGSAPAFSVGVSGHIGETGFDFLEAGPPPLSLPPEDDARFITWSWNLDARLEWDRLSVQGEFFQGANLSAFLGGIGQGVCPCLRRPIHSIGGWFDVGYEISDQLQTNLGFGAEDPDDNDLLMGRVFNQFLFVNMIYELTAGLRTGVEVSYWKTKYEEDRTGLVDPALLIADAPGRSVTIEWMVRYDF